jgi:hypothetical protein
VLSLSTDDGQTLNGFPSLNGKDDGSASQAKHTKVTIIDVIIVHVALSLVLSAVASRRTVTVTVETPSEQMAKLQRLYGYM